MLFSNSSPQPPTPHTPHPCGYFKVTEQDTEARFSQVRQGEGCFCAQMLQIEQKLIHSSLSVPDSSQTTGGKSRGVENQGGGGGGGWGVHGAIEVSGSVHLSWGRQRATWASVP